MSRAAAVLVVLAALLSGVAGVRTAGAQPTQPPTLAYESGGGCGVCRFYGVDGYAPVNQNIPLGMCDVLGQHAHSVACSGWSYWNRTRVWKARGDYIRVGFWHRGPNGLPTMRYFTYGSYWNGGVITVDRTDVGAAPYNVSSCAYDFTYGGDESLVLCEGIDW